MTPQSIINLTRHVLQDVGVNAMAFRQADEELLLYVQEGVREIALMRPDLFSTVVQFACVPGQCEQAITYAQGQRIVDVLCITGGAAVWMTDRASMDAFRPSWRTDAAGPAENWFPLQADPLRFFIYPKAPDPQSLDIRVLRVPAANYALDTTITDLPETFEPALADYVIYRSESKDDENVLTERAAAHFTAFKSKAGTGNAAV